MTSITSASSVPVLTQSFSSVSSSTIASSSRLPETPIKKETSETSLSDPNSSSKKRRISESNDDQEDDDDEEDLGDSSFASASPSKPSNTGGRRKASDEERKARLEARQARNRLSAQYSRERKKAYVEQLEGSVNTLKAENTLLRSQRDQDQLIRQTLEAKLKDSQLRIDTLETIIRTVAPSLVPLLMSSSSSSSSSSSTVSSSAFAAPSTSAIASQLDAGLSADLAYSLLQNTGLTNKEVSLPLAIAAPASTASSSLSLGTSSQQTSNEGVRLPAAEATCSDAPSLYRDAELEQSQQRMSSHSSMVPLVPKSLPRQRLEAMSMSMAAALSTKVTHSPVRLVSSHQSSRRRSRPALASLCLSYPSKRRQPVLPVKLRLSSPTLSTSTPSSPTVTRRLRLKIKVPRRLPPRLNLYLWARAMLQQQQQALCDPQAPLQVSSQA